jgi:hypothetical protein
MRKYVHCSCTCYFVLGWPNGPNVLKASRSGESRSRNYVVSSYQDLCYRLFALPVLLQAGTHKNNFINY